MVMLAAGCTTTQQGIATPGVTGSRASAAQVLPSRSTHVALTGVDPCSLLTPAQRSRLGVLAGEKGLPAQLEDNSPTCDFRFADGTPGAEYSVVVDTTRGIQLFLDAGLAANVRQVSVGGFPALDITLKAPDLLQGCTTAVGVADGQMFAVDLGQPARGTTTAQSCARTEQVAGAVLTTARTR
jgi:hypothetical protein